jgi:hypothetical protein
MIENIRHTSSSPASLLPLRTFVLAENEGEITENRESREIREIEELDNMCVDLLNPATCLACNLIINVNLSWYFPG